MPSIKLVLLMTLSSKWGFEGIINEKFFEIESVLKNLVLLTGPVGNLGKQNSKLNNASFINKLIFFLFKSFTTT